MRPPLSALKDEGLVDGTRQGTVAEAKVSGPKLAGRAWGRWGHCRGGTFVTGRVVPGRPHYVSPAGSGCDLGQVEIAKVWGSEGPWFKPWADA